MNEDDAEQFAAMTDAQLLALAEMQPAPEWDEELSDLLTLNSGNDGREITVEESARLEIMMAEYKEKQLMKARAGSWAVRRGLIDPLTWDGGSGEKKG